MNDTFPHTVRPMVYEILEATLQRRIHVDEETKRDAAARISVDALMS